MRPELIGALVGGAFALVNFATLRWLADRMEATKASPQQARTARAIRGLAWADLIFFPVVGYVVGPMVLN